MADREYTSSFGGPRKCGRPKGQKDTKPRKPIEYSESYSLACRACGSAFMSGLPFAVFCSQGCRVKFGNRRFQERARDRSPRNCVACGLAFEPAYGDKRKRYCSLKCGKSGRDAAKSRRIAGDERLRLIANTRSLIGKAISGCGYSKRSKTAEILGCSFPEFSRHIESQFVRGMSWSNRDEWHIDHIVPASSAKTYEEAIKLNHFTNLRPLWARDNMRKGAKHIYLI